MSYPGEDSESVQPASPLKSPAPYGVGEIPPAALNHLDDHIALLVTFFYVVVRFGHLR